MVAHIVFNFYTEKEISESQIYHPVIHLIHLQMNHFFVRNLQKSVEWFTSVCCSNALTTSVNVNKVPKRSFYQSPTIIDFISNLLIIKIYCLLTAYYAFLCKELRRSREFCQVFVIVFLFWKIQPCP